MKDIVVSSPVEVGKGNPGGINLNPVLFDLEIKRDGNGIPLPFNMQPIELMNIEGLIPVIINITPVYNLPLLLGLEDLDDWQEEESEQYSEAVQLSPMDRKRNA